MLALSGSWHRERTLDMATQTFLWGTVKGTPDGAEVKLFRGIRFIILRQYTFLAAENIDKGDTAAWPQLQTSPLTSFVFHGALTDWVCLEWYPPKTLPTAKSVLRIGELHPIVFIASATVTLLNRDEAKELSDAIRKVSLTYKSGVLGQAKAAKTAVAVP